MSKCNLSHFSIYHSLITTECCWIKILFCLGTHWPFSTVRLGHSLEKCSHALRGQEKSHKKMDTLRNGYLHTFTRKRPRLGVCSLWRYFSNILQGFGRQFVYSLLVHSFKPSWIITSFMYDHHSAPTVCMDDVFRTLHTHLPPEFSYKMHDK